MEAIIRESSDLETELITTTSDSFTVEYFERGSSNEITDS